MNLLINALILSKKNTGLGVYTFNILEHSIGLIVKEFDVDILCQNVDFLPENCKKFCVELKYSNYFDRMKKIKKFDYSKYDIVWSTTQHGNVRMNCKQAITIHDLTPIFYPNGRLHQYFYYKFYLKKLVKKSDIIFTVSENTKKDVSKYYKVDFAKIINGYEYVSEDVSPVFYNEPKNYFTILGIHYPYKNIDIVIDCFKKYKDLSKYCVYIIGNDNCNYARHLKKKIKKCNLEDNFIFTGYIDDIEKNDILSKSIANIYPSKYEGFGLPILESSIRRIPVICANSSCLKEIGGKDGLYFEPNSVDELYKCINTILCKEEREKIINNQLINIKRFSWEKTVSIIIDSLKGLE